MLMVYFNQFISPQIVDYFQFISLIFPILFLIYFTILLYWILKKEYLYIMFFFLLLLVYFPNFILWFNISKKKKLINTIKIISYNIYYGKKMGIKPLQIYLKNHNADVILLQEIWSRQWNQKNNILKNYNNVIFPYIGISTKHSIINKKYIDLYNTNGHACWADIIIQNDTIRFFSIYLEPIYLTKELFKFKNKDQTKKNFKEIKKRMTISFKIHQDQLNFIKKEIKRSPFPVVVAGDLNAVPNSYEYFQLSSFLQDGFKLKGDGLGTTFHEYLYPIKIDYIFFDLNCEVHYSSVDRNINLSDHFPLISYFKILKNKIK